MAVLKDYNLSRHFEIKHTEKYRNLLEDESARTTEALLAKLQKQQGLFTKLHATKEGQVKTRYVLAHKTAKRSKPFSDGEFIKECLVDSVEILCPEKSLFRIYPSQDKVLPDGLRISREIWSCS